MYIHVPEFCAFFFQIILLRYQGRQNLNLFLLFICTPFSSLRQSKNVTSPLLKRKQQGVCKQPKLTNQEDTLNLYDSTRTLANNLVLLLEISEHVALCDQNFITAYQSPKLQQMSLLTALSSWTSMVTQCRSFIVSTIGLPW